MSKIIKYSESNNRGINSPIITFDCLFDTDIGMMRFIKKNYRTSGGLFSEEFFDNHTSPLKLAKVLYTREKKNPISVCIKDPNNDQLADELYEKFINENYKEIVDNCVTTEFYNLLEAFSNLKEIDPVIIYKNDVEKQCLEEDDLTCKFKLLPVENISPSSFNQVYLKYIDDKYVEQIVLKECQLKSIYFANYKFNQEETGIIPNKYTTALSVLECTFKVFDIYDRNKLGIDLTRKHYEGEEEMRI